MNIIRNSIQKLYITLTAFANKYLYSENIDIKDRCFLFVIFLNITGTALIIPPMFIVKHTALGFIYLTLEILLLLQIYLLSKFKQFDLFEKITCVSSELVMAPIFFMSGGLAGGGLFFFLTVILSSVLVLRGLFRNINLIFSIILMMYSVFLSLEHPEWCYVNGEEVSPAVSGFSNTISCLACASIIIAVVSYQLFLHKEMDSQLEKAKQDAEQANAAKSMFLANISHEIRTPMGVVIGLSDMIQKEDNIHAIHEMSSNINRVSNMLLNIINDVLDYEKINKGVMDIVDVEYFTDDIVTDFRTIGAGRSEMKGLKYSIHVSDTLPKVLYGDEIRLRQIGTNIINNAIKYTDQGSVDVLVDYDLEREMVILSVKDTGKGIKPEDIPYIFDSFQRVDIKNNRHIEGTGLGLAITKKLTDAMGGSVKVASEYGVGSTFIAEVAHKKVDNPTISRDMNQIKTYNIGKTKILYVDDTKLNTIVFNGLLKGTDINASYAFSGMEALEIVKEKSFDIIFLDYFMPQMDGIETFNKLRESGITCPIIVVTADAVDDAEQKLLAAGFDTYLTKPVKRENLLAIIEKYVR